jgi:hypothetical protein
MALPTLPPKETRPKALTIRISKRVYSLLCDLADTHNLSQSDVVTFLVEAEAAEKKRLKGKSARYRRK